MITQTLFCQHSATCHIYTGLPHSVGNPTRLDIIEEDDYGRYSCMAFRTWQGMTNEKPFYYPGKECSHIEILNLLDR